MGHIRNLTSDAAAWATILLVAGLPLLLGSIKLMIWVFALGDWITGSSPAPWPFS